MSADALGRWRILAAPRARRQGGAVAITVGIALLAIVGFLGLVIDMGHLFIAKAEMQNAMDACALAAAKELTGVSTDQLQIAENAGITVGGSNNVDFQSGPVGIVPDDIGFSATLAGPYQSRAVVEAAGATQVLAMKYAKCETTHSGIAMHFMPVMGKFSGNAVAHAVATLAPSQTSCGIPLAMCRQNSPPATCPGGGSPNAYGLCPGQWYDGKFEAGGGSTGNFNWIDFSPPAGGASELSGLLSGAGVCNTSVPNPVGQTGIVQSSATAWNSRFGLYKSGAGNPSLSSAPPDYTGYSYTPANWPAKYDAYSDFRNKRGAYASYGDTVDTVDAGNIITGLSINSSFNVATHGSGGQLAASGANRRLDIAPIVDCSGWASSQTVPIQAWACVLMLHPLSAPGDTVWLEYLGLSTDPGSPCATTGLPAGPGGAGPKVPALVR